MKPNYKVINEKIIYDGFITLKIDQLLKDDQNSLYYHTILVGSDAVSIITKTNDDLFLIADEYRHPIKKSVLGCPGGRIEKGEKPIDAAQRELEEETGYVSTKWTYLGSSYCLPAICEQKIHFVLAEDAYKKGTTKQDPFENIFTRELSMQEIHENIMNGNEIDGVFLTALSFYNVFNDRKYSKKL